MKKAECLLAIVLWAGPAWAADQPVYAPPPAWVQPIDVPKPSAKENPAAVQVLLMDTQDRYDAEGQDTYFESAERIQTPQGLDAVGTIAVNWNPDTERILIHKLRIIRGDQTIDILGDNKKLTVLRRENNLERAMLDGTLTAAIEPEGLQVGDILDFAFTREDRDPITRGRSGRISYLPRLPVGRFRIREIWPEGLNVRWQKADELAVPKVTTDASRHELVIDMSDTQPPKVPNQAPARFSDPGRFEVSLAPTWGDVSALMAPLYQKTSEISANSPLRQEIDAIKAASMDPKVRAAAALRLVQDKVRYVFLGVNNGGFVPAPADVTWSRRFGDCKGKTVLLLGILHELGIEAEAALVNSVTGDGLDQRLPFVGAFDHVLVRATIGNQAFWLDGTRTGDRTLDEIAVPGFKWALPVRAAGTTLLPMTAKPLEKPDELTELKLDASAGLDAPAPAHAVLTLRGDAAVERRLKLTNMTPSQAEQYLRDYWKGLYDFITVEKVDASYDENTGEERLSMGGSAKMEWKLLSGGRHRYEADGSNLGWKADFDRESGPHQDAPFSVPHPYFNKWMETILLPDGGKDISVVGDDVTRTIAGREFRRVAKIDKGAFTMEAGIRSIAAEFPATEAPAAKTALRDLHDESVYLIAAPAVAPKAEIVTMPQGTPTTAEGFLLQARAWVLKGDIDKALASCGEAIRLKPGLAAAYMARGLVYLQKSDVAKATADFDTAARYDPKQTGLLSGRGYVYLAKLQLPQALDAFNQAIKLTPQDANSRYGRGMTYQRMRQADKALADFDEALRLQPSFADIHVRRAEIFMMQGLGEQSLSEIETLASIQPENAVVQGTLGNALLMLDRKAEAHHAFDKSISIKPSAVAYLGRAQSWSDQERSDALTDIDLALRLNPQFAEAYGLRAGLRLAAHDTKRAIADFNEAIRLQPGNLELVRARSGAYEEAGQFELAAGDLTRLLANKPDDTGLLRGRCRDKALTNKHLESALADCQAALRLEPHDDELLEARAFVLIRMKRFDDAIADYNAVLARRPNSAIAHFGRGTAELGKNATAEGQADLAAAHQTNANIDKDFIGTFSNAYSYLANSNPAPADPAAASLRRGADALEKRDNDTAVRELDQAIKLKPTALAYADRGIAYYWKGAFDKAQADIDMASSLDPREVIAFHGRGLLAMHNRQYKAAIEAFSGAISTNQGDAFAYLWRANGHYSLKEWDEALADYTEALRLNPKMEDLQLQRAEIFVLKRDGTRALAETDGFLAANHDANVRAHALRGSALKLLGRKDEARTELDRSIALQPTVEAYLERAQTRPHQEIDQAQADVNSALKIDPKSVIAYRIRAALDADSRDFPAALQALDEAVKLEPDNEGIMFQRADIYASSHQFDQAIQVADQLRVQHPDNALSLNNSCWFRAVAGKDLESALNFCNMALKLKPDAPGFLDSRGLAYLRLGKFDEAIQDYTAALNKQPKMATSLLGRSIAERSKGAKTEADSDLVAARAANERVESRFADYGVTP